MPKRVLLERLCDLGIEALRGARRRPALSGTPFRSDTRAIPFVRYADDEAAPHYEYGYGDALADGGVVRPVYFPRVDGMMEWSAPTAVSTATVSTTPSTRPGPASACGRPTRSTVSGCPTCWARPTTG